MSEQKHTQGPVEISGGFPGRRTIQRSEKSEHIISRDLICTINEGSRFADGNASMIKEAFDVTHETGLTPRELAERVKELDGERSSATHDVITERRRQIDVEGFPAEHDDIFLNNELIEASISYLLVTAGYFYRNVPPHWPWHSHWWKPSTRRRNLVKAAALIIAEVERIDRNAEQ